jgi:hypothetical protein
VEEAAAAEPVHSSRILDAAASRVTQRRAALAAVLIGAAIVFAQFDPLNQPIRGDRANWEYMAHVISRGGVPYRDIVNIKTPLSAYIGAAAILLTKPFGVRDIYAVRFAYLGLALFCIAFTFLVALEYFDSLRIAALAAAILTGVNFFVVNNSAGIQPKTPVVLFGLICLWAIRKDRPMLAGVAGMLAALTWQPGLLFAGAAGLAFSRYLTSWRDRKAVRVVFGASIPLAVIIGYFWAVGALRDFYLWAFDFNLHVYGPGEAKPLSLFVKFLRDMISNQFRQERLYCAIAVVGVLFACWEELKCAWKGRFEYIRNNAPQHALVIAPLVYFIFCMVDVQGAQDFIPFLPFIAIFSALAMVNAIDRLLELARWLARIPNHRAVHAAAFAVVLLLVVGLTVVDAFSYKRKGGRLREQQAEVAEIVSNLQPGDQIFVHGATEVLVLSGLTSASKYFFLDRGKDGYLERVEPGGFDGWLERMKAERPRIVLLTRLRRVDRKRDLLQWVGQDYELRRLRIFNYYIRKD